MTARSKAAIKAFFETGDKPTQVQFEDLIDSYLDYNPVIEAISTVVSTGTGFLKVEASSSAVMVPVGTIGQVIVQSSVAASVRTELGITGNSYTYSVGSAAGTIPVFTAAQSLDGLVEAITGMIESPTSGKNYVLDQYAAYPYNIEWVAAKCSAGAAGIVVQVEGSAVGNTAVEVSATERIASAAAGRSVAVGNTVKIVCTSASSAADMAFTVKVIRQ